MSSIIDKTFMQHVHNENENDSKLNLLSVMDKVDERDYYSQLFSLNSEDTEFCAQRDACRNMHTQDWTETSQTDEDKWEDISITSSSSSGSSYYNLQETDDHSDHSFAAHPTTDKMAQDFIQNINLIHQNNDIQSDSNSDMSISSGSSSMEEYYQDCGQVEEEGDTGSTQSHSSYDSLGFLDEKEIFNCFKGDILDDTAQKKWEQNLYKEVDDEANVDIIATYNIQNRYDHMLAAEMMMQQNFTFLALQEPHASHHRQKQGWSDFRCKELASARITAYETDLQVILYDNWKWGGKEISKFESLQNGRIAAIAFGFRNKQKLGIISIYGITESYDSDEKSKKDTLNTRNTTTFLVKKIIGKWKQDHPGIGIMIMGDLQETLSEGDSDNVGDYRKGMFPNGILKNTLSTHTSICRGQAGERPYITRFGSAGGRGIDHILVPNADHTRDWFIEGTIDSIHSAKFFPSDHALLACTFARRAKNNRIYGSDSNAYDFKKIFQIKMQRTGPSNDDLILDESQFKGSRNYAKQKDLLGKIQKITADDSDETEHYLGNIEKRIKKLNKDLWKQGEKQKVDGKANKLVKISEKQALRISYITKSFNENVRAIMTALDLSGEKDTISQGGVIRKSLHKGKGFKNFQNLPIPTKLRYLGKYIKHILRRIQDAKNKLCKWETLEKSNGETIGPPFDFHNLHQTLDSNSLRTKAAKIRQEYFEEVEERSIHMKACNSHDSEATTPEQPNGHAKLERCNSPSNHKDDNNLNLDDKTVRLINAWLGEEECQQGFNTQNNADPFEFLGEDTITKWTHHILHWDALTINPEQKEHRLSMIHDLEKSEQILENLQNNIVSAQCKYKIQTLHFFINTNKISSFTNKVLPKSRDAPVPHSTIWDPFLKEFRQCASEEEEMIATGNHHNHWMSPSAAKESCAFAEVITEGKLGPRGIKLKPDRRIGAKDIPLLIKNGNRLPNKIRQKFISAHGKHTANLFQEPDQDRQEFFYPFFLENNEGKNHMEDFLKEHLMRAISGIPGKARHGGFQMAVIGRFGKRWREVLFQLIKLMLVMRYVPPDLKKISRFPIPKPGRVGEYRPISLCHDIYCFLNGVVTVITSKGIENAKLLHEGLTSYRPGMGCVTLVGVEQAFREDCIQSGIPATQIDEDEEKFFDRIPLEIILASMRVCGFPAQGFLEFKANCMDSKSVEIITNKGNARATFSCGLEQGNPNSPTIANLVILMKHKIWNTLCKELLIKYGKEEAEKFHSYSFKIVDKQDGKLTIKMIGYCDDNSRFISTINEEDLIFITNRYIKLTGDLSMVTKIGRKGSKSEVHFYNLSAATALKLKEIETVAWSFSEDMPTTEYVPFKLCLQKSEEDKLQTWINTSDELSEEQQNTWKERLFPEEHRHLGLTSTLNGKANGTRERVIKKVKKRIVEINSQKLGAQAQKICNNMLCTSVPTYAPLQSGHDPSQLLECDNLVAQCLRKRRGLSKSDAMHRFWIGENLGGFGFKSFLEEDLISVARELEVVLNSNELDSKAIRARLEAYNCNPEGRYKNHVKEAVLKLAKYGVYLRDQNEEILNYTLSGLARETKYAPIGSAAYKDGFKPTIGLGKRHLLDLAMGSSLETVIRKIIKGASRSEIKLLYPQRLPVSFQKLEKLIEQAKLKRFEEVTRMFKYWEWSLCEEHPQIPKTLKEWNVIDIGKQIRQEHPNTYLDLSAASIREMCLQKMKISFNQVSNPEDPTSINTHDTALRKLLDSESPLLIATDGSLTTKGKSRDCTAAFVACKLTIPDEESICDGNWEDRTTEPLIARIMALPQRIGTEPTDIAHGEGLAIWLQEASFDGNIPRGIISDSEAVRKCVINVRENALGTIGRKFIRKESAGISKHVVGAFRDSYKNNAEVQEGKNLKAIDANKNNKMACKCKIWEQSLLLRLSIFVEQSRKWTIAEKCKEDDADKVIWPLKYWDNHRHRPILKVNSHQLNSIGTERKTPHRYKELVPKLAPLNANHWADICAGLPTLENIQAEDSSENINIPYLAQRFFLTWGGMSIDKDVASRMRKIFMNEKVKRLRNKPTQGLLWRLMQDMHTSWDTILKHKGWLRSLAGFSNTHTRALYKSELYRNGNWLEHHPKVALNSVSSRDRINKCLKCTWCNVQQNTPLCGSYGQQTKGNRMHHIHFCKHPKLQRFRGRIEGLIEAGIHEMFETVKTAQGIGGAEKLLLHITNTLITLHERNSGRLKRPPKTEQYVQSVEKWCQQTGTKTLIEGISRGKVSYQQIFGMVPLATEEGLGDCYLGTCDAMLFGLVPKQINTVIERTSRSLYGGPFPLAAKKVLAAQLMRQWEKVQQLMIAKACGLHRLLSTICKQREKDWKLKYKDNLDLSSYQLIKKEVTRHVSAKRPNVSAHADTKRNKVKFGRDEIKKKCYGISCRHQVYSKGKSNVVPNMIPLGTTQCQRCSNKQGAMKAGAATLRTLTTEIKPEAKQQILKSIEQESLNSPKYGPLMNLLHNRTDTMVSNNAKFKSKKRKISDKDKSICRIIIEEVQRTPQDASSEIDTISTCANRIENTLSRNQEILQNDITYERKLLQEGRAANKKRKHVNIIDLTSPHSQEIRSNTETSLNKKVNLSDAQSSRKTIMMTKWQLFSGNDLDRDIEISRALRGRNVFVADQDATFLIQSYKLTDDWGRFGRMFRSPVARNNRPPGLYLIPIFRGETGGGHWSTIIIWRQGRRNRGYHLDSLGKAVVTGPIFDKIRGAFTGKRDRFSWVQVDCQPQEELECGFRTAEAIRIICIGRNEGRGEEECIREAGRAGVISGSYCPATLRRKVANRLIASN